MPFTGRIRYDRRVTDGFLDLFHDGGVARSLTEYARKARFPVDLQFRRNPKTGAEHASLYVGLTSVLNVYSKPKRSNSPAGGLALDAHRTWTDGRYGFDASWRETAPIEEWAKRWTDVENYLEKVIPAVSDTSHARIEGAVQAAVSAFSDGTRVMLDREVVPHFLDTTTKRAVLEPISQGLVAALVREQPVTSRVPPSFGAECDLLALDDRGRLLAVEVKPHANSLVWTPAQATMYARVLQAWVEDDSAGTPGWQAVIRGMLHQRRKLGLADPFSVEPSEPPQVVPVIAFQRGASGRLV